MPKPLSEIDNQFWTTSPSVDPKAQWRWRVTIPALREVDTNRGPKESLNQISHAFYAKSIEKPRISMVDLDKDAYMTAGNKVLPNITGDPKFDFVSMTLIDTVYPNTTRALLKYLRNSGFQDTQYAKKAAVMGGPGRAYLHRFDGKSSNVILEQLDSRGSFLEKWTLVDAYPAKIDFGKLDYSSDALVEISVQWGYRTFTVEFPEIGGEPADTYFKDYLPGQANISRDTDGSIGEQQEGFRNTDDIIEAQDEAGLIQEDSDFSDVD